MDITDPITVSALSSVLMVLIWLVYLQLILREYRTNTRPFMIIQHAHENDPAALCLLVNLSTQPVHIQCVMATVQGAFGRIRRYVTDYTRITPDDRNVQSRLRLGPIQPGGYLVLGSFEEILLGRRTDPDDSEGAEELLEGLRDINSFEINVAAVYRPSLYHIGARRHFTIEHREDGTAIRALSIHTEQMTSRRKWAAVREWVENRLDPIRRGIGQTQHSDQSDHERLDDPEISTSRTGRRTP